MSLSRGVLRQIPPPVLDVAIALAVLVAHTAPFLATSRVADLVEGWTLSQYLPVLGQALPLIWRRRAPVPVLVVVLLATVVYGLRADTAPQPVAYAVLVAIYTVAATGARRERAWAATILLGGIGLQITGLVLKEPGADTITRGLVMYGAAWAIGRSAANRQAYARQLEREKELEAQRVAVRERAAIARDMHDILGHAISLMIVQAESGPLIVRSEPERAEAAFDTIASAGRSAMTQVRRLLGLLKDDPAGGVPLLDQIPALVEGVDRAGTRATIKISGVPGTLPPDAEATAYRVVQEALTNTVKHASATLVTVLLDWRKDALLIHVIDDGRGHSEGTDGGHGLKGIRERAMACGGTASFGPGPGHQGFSVSVRLPLAAS
ncbi:sensor histidine kinase [Nonomuraea sp. NPDC005983]|uniref:sensor histidine kinase n=1 Tax=Nonomuraea sp. NPDC005983 TaxID=3155595 RepID=UPI0033B4D3E3